MRNWIASTVVIAGLIVVGCKSDSRDDRASKTLGADVCSHCPGVQTMQADGTCSGCDMKIADACSNCPGVQVATADKKCPGCGAKVK